MFLDGRHPTADIRRPTSDGRHPTADIASRSDFREKSPIFRFFASSPAVFNYQFNKIFIFCKKDPDERYFVVRIKDDSKAII